MGPGPLWDSRNANNARNGPIPCPNPCPETERSRSRIAPRLDQWLENNTLGPMHHRQPYLPWCLQFPSAPRSSVPTRCDARHGTGKTRGPVDRWQRDHWPMGPRAHKGPSRPCIQPFFPRVLSAFGKSLSRNGTQILQGPSGPVYKLSPPCTTCLGRIRQQKWYPVLGSEYPQFVKRVSPVLGLGDPHPRVRVGYPWPWVPSCVPP